MRYHRQYRNLYSRAQRNNYEADACRGRTRPLPCLTAILQHSDYEVDTALDGLTALEYLLANDYDAAILDIMMPGMDGIEVLKRTRAAGKRLPIIMLTAKSEVSDKVEGLDAGANDYLTKPFAAKELLARIAP